CPRPAPRVPAPTRTPCSSIPAFSGSISTPRRSTTASPELDGRGIASHHSPAPYALSMATKRDLEQHIAVFGESGSGKTVLLSSFYGGTQDPQFIRDHDLNVRSEEHTSELQSRFDLVCRLLLA